VTPNSTKWIVVLTDGVSNRERMEQVRERLSEAGDGGSINMLFITVNLPENGREEIQRACIRKPTDKIITADSGTAAIQNAWVQVGKHINSDGATLAWDNHPEGDHGIPDMLRKLKSSNFTYVFGRLDK